jgi:signal transduction histidine kinase/CheY-like chemotaxis protein
MISQWVRKRRINRYVVAVMIITLAALLRVWPLQALGTTLVWLTFYPAVMVVAIYGGLFGGLAGTMLACLVAIFLGPLLVGQPFIKSPADWLGLSVFVMTGTMISVLAESMLRANERARKAQKQAESANKAKSTFLANMSHELRTPLNAILGFSRLMGGEAGISSEQRKTLALITRSGEKLLEMINEVLDMAKVESGQLKLENACFDLVETLADITGLMHVRAQDKGLELIWDSASVFPQFVSGDAIKLRQVLINLLGNAIRYTDQGSVTLRLNARPADVPERLWLIAEVIDTGAGIAPEQQLRIFEPFVQVDPSNLQKGTGLGLAITRQHVLLMGGRIGVQSTLGEGSCFRVEIPVAAVDQSAPDEVVSKRSKVLGLAPDQSVPRILVVDDQIENWLLLQRILEEAGFTVHVAENGLLGVEAFQAWQPDFIWMDVRMPVLDGLQATQRIRTLPGGKAVKIAALTASVFEDERDRVMAVGMDDFLRKPFTPDEIFDCLQRHLNVRYTYEEVSGVAPSPDTTLRPQAFAALPADLRDDLHDAVLKLDTTHMENLIGRIVDFDSALGGVLKHHADQLAYTEILRALDAGSEVKEPLS